MSFTFYLALTLTNIRNQVARPTSRASVPASQLAKQLLHTHFDTRTLLHTDAFTHRHVYTQTLLPTEAFTHTHTLFFYTHTHFHTQRLLDTGAFTCRCFYTQKLLHTNTFTHRDFYTQKLLHADAFTHRHFYTQTLLPTGAFTHTHLLRNIIANYCCGMHLTCKNNPIKPDRRNWLIHREIQFEVCFLRPCSEEGSDATEPVVNTQITK